MEAYAGEASELQRWSVVERKKEQVKSYSAVRREVSKLLRQSPPKLLLPAQHVEGGERPNQQ